MLILGLAGGSGSGKGMVSSFFAKQDIPSIDTDFLYRKMTSAGGICIPYLKEAFGDAVINEMGALDRKILSSIVFSSDEKRKLLNSITHKLILEEVRKLIRSYKDFGYSAVLIDAPLLFESGFNKECDMIISVLCDEDVRVARIIERDKITAEMARLRIKSQLSDSFLRENSDFILINNSTPNNLEIQVTELLNKLNLKGDKK